jgi:hypothetical protein
MLRHYPSWVREASKRMLPEKELVIEPTILMVLGQDFAFTSDERIEVTKKCALKDST